MLRIYRTVAPASLPVSLVEAWAHLRLDPSGSPLAHPEDVLINLQLAAATDYLDGWAGVLGRCMIEQTWCVEFARPGDFGQFKIEMPVAGIVSVEVLRDGAYETVPPSNYALRQRDTEAFVRPRSGLSWGRYDSDEAAFRVTFRAGYGDDPAAVPAPLRCAILLMLGELFENREAIVTGGTVQKIPAFDALIAPYRIRPNG
ncbi:MAG: hypothetical protein QM698_11530 [Micropepsaceae bacterium]